LVHLVLSDQLTASSNNGKILGHKRFEKRPQKIRICNKSNYVKMSNESNVGPNMNVHANDNDNATTATTQASACDLHDAILANSQSVVELYLEQQGADPNRSPQLPPVGVISSAENERARDLHRTLGRVFRRRQGGSIHPLHVAVCNAYHHCVLWTRSSSRHHPIAAPSRSQHQSALEWNRLLQDWYSCIDHHRISKDGR
jgi:hypothetical protein